MGGLRWLGAAALWLVVWVASGPVAGSPGRAGVPAVTGEPPPTTAAPESGLSRGERGGAASESGVLDPEPGLPPLPPLTKREVERVQAIAAVGGHLNDHRFIKVGDSMTVSRSYLRCFARPMTAWGDHEGLAATVAHFEHEAGRSTNPFLRVSRAARVGWSVRSAIRGARPPVRREIATMRPRFATVMFGTNDLVNRTPRKYAERMWRLLEMLETRGVVPVVSSVMPQRHDPHDNLWVERYNLVLRALTKGRDLPLLDLHRDFLQLPRLGLAGDGVHANVHRAAGRSAPCDFSVEGLRSGHNVRNLRTLQQLARMLKVVRGESVPLGQARKPTVQVAGPVGLAVPHGDMHGWEVPSASRQVFEITVVAAGELHVLAVPHEGPPLRLEIAAKNDQGQTVLGARRSEWLGEVEPGRHRLVVERMGPPVPFVLTVHSGPGPLTR